MRYAIVMEYYSFYCIGQPDVIISINNTFSEAVDAVINIFIAEFPDGASFADLRIAVLALASHRLKCDEYVLRIHSREQTVGYRGQTGYFSIANADSNNVFIRFLEWLPKQNELLTGDSLVTSDSGD